MMSENNNTRAHVFVSGRVQGVSFRWYTQRRAQELELTGWVRVYQVRAGDYASAAPTVEQEDSRGFLAGLASFSRKASGFFTQDSAATSSGTATIGVRGLSETDIRSAKPDFAELEQMESYASKPERMARFTAQGGLRAHKLPYIKDADE